MIFSNKAVFFIAWRYIHGSKKQRFASFVALLATLGIAIGVCALIVVSSIMQGLQDRLKSNILSDSPHVVVKAGPSDIKRLLDNPDVIAMVPFVEGEAMIQYGNNLSLITLQASDYSSFFVSLDYADKLGVLRRKDIIRNATLVPVNPDSKDPSTNAAPAAPTAPAPTAPAPTDIESHSLAHSDSATDSLNAHEIADEKAQQNIDALSSSLQDADHSKYKYALGAGYLIRYHMPERDANGYRYGSVFEYAPGSFKVALNFRLLSLLDILNIGEDKVRIVSTKNARYTPLGLTPIQRNFLVEDVIRSLDNSAAPAVVGNYEDVRKFFRLKDDETYYRLYLADPFAIESVAESLRQEHFQFTDWRERYGEFFKAVGLEKITMSTMLCLIIIVAAFNILSSLTMLVSSRVSEIAIFKTIGLSNRSLLSIFIMVGMSASVVGSLLGLIFGIPLAINAQTILNTLGISVVNGELPIEIDVVNIAIIVVLCMVVSILCTFYPAYYASKADPVRNLVVS